MKSAMFAAALALPMSADGPSFLVRIGCEGGLPMVIQIESTRPDVMAITLPELMEVCAQIRPEKQQWQGGS